MKNDNSSDNLLDTGAWTLVHCRAASFALPSDAVQKVISLSDIRSLPNSPPHILGVSHVEGQILPCVSLNVLIGCAESAEPEGAHEGVVLAVGDRRAVLLVDGADRQVMLNDALRAQISRLDNAGQGHPVFAEMPFEEDSVLMLDPSALVTFSAIENDRGSVPGLVGENSESEAEDSELILYLFFRAGSQPYACSVMDIEEVCDLGECTALPSVPPEIKGLYTIREQSYLGVSLAASLGISSSEEQQGLMVSAGGETVIFAVEQVETVRSIHSDDVRQMNGGSSMVTALIERPGEPLRAIVEPDRLSSLIPGLKQFTPSRKKRAEVKEDIFSKMLLMRCGGEQFALPVDVVVRIDDEAVISQVDDESFMGVINSESDVLPVVRPELVFGEERGVLSSGAVIIIEQERRFYALPVDEPSRIESVPVREIRRRSGGAVPSIAGSIRLDDRLVTLLDMSWLSGRHAPQQEHFS